MKIKKILSRIERNLIFMLDGVNTKKYMYLYNRWLKKNGMMINGSARYIHHSAMLDGQGYELITLGNNVVISLGVTILVHDFSVEAGFRAIGKDNGENEAHTMKRVYIGENCFIGANSTVLGGAQIGKNCIIAAGTVVLGKKYPEDSIIGGNPAKVIGSTTKWISRKISERKFETGYFN